MVLLRVPQLILLDLDGTLVDSVPDLAFAVDSMMQQLHLPKRGIASVREWVGNGMERLIKRALVNDMHGEPDEALFQRALPLFKHAYNQCNGHHSLLYPNVKTTLQYLHDHAFLMACITNKPRQFTEPLLEQLGIAHFFNLILSGDSLPSKKPDPLPLIHATQHFNVLPQNCVMIGDSKNDVQAARAAHLQVICVSYGYNHGEDIRLSHPDAVLDDFGELRDLIGVLRPSYA
jgi:phosphoglycolate phosphatase